MFFQPIALDKTGFQFKPLSTAKYPMHWHSDLEILYCRKGNFTLRNEENAYQLEAGDIIVIGSCEPHELTSESEVSLYVISLGFLFFGDRFEQIRNLRFESPVLRRNAEVKQVITNIAALHHSTKSLASDMALRGQLYHLVHLLLNGLPVTDKPDEHRQERLFAISKIQNVLDFVNAHYQENITIEQAAEVSGYEKSSFCRNFKNATNTTFHNYLNTYRIKKAKILLTESNRSISDISYDVGFSQHKNFCRLFKASTGLSPSEYRKKYR